MGKLNGERYCCSVEASLQIPSRCAPTPGAEAADICTVFSAGKKDAYMNVCRDEKKDTAEMFFNG